MCIPLPFVPSRLVHVHAFFNGLVAHLKKLGLKFDWKQLKPVWLGDVSPYHNNWGIRSTAYLNAHTIGYCLCKIIQFSSRTLKKKKNLNPQIYTISNKFYQLSFKMITNCHMSTYKIKLFLLRLLRLYKNLNPQIVNNILLPLTTWQS